MEDLDPGVHEKPFVDAVEAQDLAVLAREQRAPVERGLARAPAVCSRDLEILAVVRRVAEQLLGDAADVDAGAAEAPGLGDRDARAVACGDAARPYAARSASYGEEVEIVVQRLLTSGSEG
jgi:hypothetical protein